MPRFSILFPSLLFPAIFVSFLQSAHAGPPCEPRDSVLETLSTRYNEQPVAIGVTANGGLIEVIASKNGETWSVIVTTPQGMSCLVAAGSGWRSVAHAATDPEA